MVLILSNEDIRDIFSMKEAITKIEEAFREYAEGRVQMPQRQLIRIPEEEGWIANMPAFLEETKAVGTKVVTVYPRNPSKNRPTTMATIILNDYSTGEPISIMDGGYLTSVRTGAVGGLAAKYLSRDDAKTVGLFGAGFQAKTQLEALFEVRDIEKVYVYDLREDISKEFSSQMSRKLGIDVIPISTPKKAIMDSDIIITASTSKTPVFNGELIQEGTHINAIGAHTSITRELDTFTIKRSKVVVDQIEASLREYGEILIPIKEGNINPEHVYAELGEIITGKKVGRSNENETTVFKSGGLAIQDIAIAQLAFTKAIKTMKGTRIDLVRG
jgi:ornithine cyclodeaminase/alanine dehydrogenase